jgi:hypothetical protein
MPCALCCWLRCGHCPFDMFTQRAHAFADRKLQYVTQYMRLAALICHTGRRHRLGLHCLSKTSDNRESVSRKGWRLHRKSAHYNLQACCPLSRTRKPSQSTWLSDSVRKVSNCLRVSGCIRRVRHKPLARTASTIESKEGS